MPQKNNFGFPKEHFIEQFLKETLFLSVKNVSWETMVALYLMVRQVTFIYIVLFTIQMFQSIIWKII